MMYLQCFEPSLDPSPLHANPSSSPFRAKTSSSPLQLHASVLLNTPCGSIKNTPLHVAAEKGNFEAVKHLLSNKLVKRNPKNAILQTPLHLAAKHGHTR